MIRLLALMSLLFSSVWAAAGPTPTVDCDAGQSLNHTLANMNKFLPATVTVKGTCTEYVLVEGFNGLTLTGLPGATLQQPSTNPPAGTNYVLSIRASRSVTVAGLTIHSLPTIFSGIGVGGGSTDVRLRDLKIDGNWGVEAYEASQLWLTRVNVNITSGYAAVSVFDKSDMHITDSLVQRPADGQWHAGLSIGSGHVTMQGTTIHDMQQGINMYGGGSLDLVNFDSSAGTDVIIDNPSGNNSNGVLVAGASILSVSSVNLRISNAGQPFGWDTGAVVVTEGSTLKAAPNQGGSLIITGSQGQGVIVANNSHAILSGASITGGLHGGLVVVNLSTAEAALGDPVTFISGNVTDLFCDSKSEIFGTANIANVGTVQCNNLVPGPYESLP